MGTTLENGVYLPSEGERNCYAGLKTNWEILDQKVADVTALQQAVAGALTRKIVTELPTEDIDPNCIYMILSGTSATENVYNEFMYVNNAWELIGTSATDLTNYYTKSEVDGKLLLKANASDLTSHTGDTTIHVTTADKNRWNNQTYAFRYSSTALVASSTNSNTLLDNTDNLKIGDKVIDSDGVLFSITAIDTQNSTFTIGTALIDLAQDSGVVHKSGNETINGELTVTKLISNSIQSATGIIQIQSSGTNRSVAVYNGSSAGDGGGFWAYGKDSTNGSDCRLQIYNTTKSRYERVDLVGSQFLPTPSGELDCGRTSNKWKSINGVEPSSLSLPSGNVSDVIDISSYITALDGTDNTYIAPANGWITINMNNCLGIHATITGSWSDSRVRASAGAVKFLMPVLKNQTVTLTIHGGTINNARFIPCQGNV